MATNFLDGRAPRRDTGDKHAPSSTKWGHVGRATHTRTHKHTLVLAALLFPIRLSGMLASMPKTPALDAVLLVTLVAVGALGVGCDDGPSREQKRDTAIREQIQQTISQIEAKSRTKAQQLGMATAQTAQIEEIKKFVCTAVIKSLRGKKTMDDRSAHADDLTEYDCRRTEPWLAVLRATAKRQGMENSGAADLSDARTFVCRRIKESLDVVADKNKDALIIEAKLYDCVL